MRAAVQYLRMRTAVDAIPFVAVCIPLALLAKQQIPRLYGLESGVGISPARLVPVLLACALIAATGSRLGETYEEAMLSRRPASERAQLVALAVCVAVAITAAMSVAGVPLGGLIRVGCDCGLFFGIALLLGAYLPRMAALATCLLVSWSIQTLPWWFTSIPGTWTDMRGFTTPLPQWIISIAALVVGSTAWLGRGPQTRGAIWQRLAQ